MHRGRFDATTICLQRGRMDVRRKPTRVAANADGRTDGCNADSISSVYIYMSSNADRAAMEHTTHPIPAQTNDHRSDLVTRVLAYYFRAMLRSQGTMTDLYNF